MNESNYEVLNDKLYSFVCDNGLSVYLMPNKESKNFFITLGVNFGASVTRYKVGDTTYDVTPGIAHYIEHRVADFSKDKEAEERIRNLGSMPNACTNYLNTRYFIYGSLNILENMKVLFDRVFHPNFNAEDILKEQNIILEEYYMYNDDPSSKIYDKLCENLYKNHYMKIPVIGLPGTIKSIRKKEIERIYKDFYVPKNMFLVITGNFESELVYDYIINYMKKIKYKEFLAKPLKVREPLKVNNEYEEISLEVEEAKVALGFKCDIKTIKGINDILKGYYISLILNSLFSPTSNLFERYKKEKIISTSFSTTRLIENSFYDVKIMVDTIDPNRFIDCIKKDLKVVELSKVDFERKKKTIISDIIMTFESIEDANDFLSYSVSKYNNPMLDFYNIVNKLNYEDALKVVKSMNIDNLTVLKIVKQTNDLQN